MKFGRWQVTYETMVPRDGKVRWKCICECGNVKWVQSSHLINGNSKSCGCWNREIAVINNTTHGLSKIPEYGIYKNMIRRCYVPTAAFYADYGGRGIQVCDRWRGENGLQNFLSDMGRRPSIKYSLDRTNNNGNYEPLNCKWITKKAQYFNRRPYKAIENFSYEVLLTELWRRTPEYGLEGC